MQIPIADEQEFRIQQAVGAIRVSTASTKTVPNWVSSSTKTYKIPTGGKVHRILNMFTSLTDKKELKMQRAVGSLRKRDTILRVDIAGTQWSSRHIAQALVLGFMKEENPHKNPRIYRITAAGKIALKRLNEYLPKNFKLHSNADVLTKDYKFISVPVNIDAKVLTHHRQVIW